MKQADTQLLMLVKDLGIVVNLKKLELHPSLKFDFLGQLFFARFGSCEAYLSQTLDVPLSPLKVCFQYNDSYGHHWNACINEEDCEIGQDAYETFPMASQD